MKKKDHIHNWVSDGNLISSKKCGQCGAIKKFELALQDQVNELEPYIDRVVRALGHKNALVTDESYVSDFLTFEFDQTFQLYMIRQNELKKASKKLKIDIDEKELVIDVAKRLRKHERKSKTSS